MIADRLAARGIALRSYRSGEHRARCPQTACGCKRGAALAVRIDADGDGATWQCHRCGWRGGVSVRHGEQLTASPSPAAKVVSIRDPERPARLFAKCHLIKGGTVAADYLKARACRLPAPDGGLRWHLQWRHLSGYVGPALIAAVTSISDAARVQTLHATWISRDGTKALVDPARILLKGYRKTNGVIRLWPDRWIDRSLGVAEGIESALSLAHKWLPSWACIDAGNLAVLPVFSHDVQTLIIAVDRDANGTGQRAALTCARRWEAAGRTVILEIPSEIGREANDEARRCSKA